MTKKLVSVCFLELYHTLQSNACNCMTMYSGLFLSVLLNKKCLLASSCSFLMFTLLPGTIKFPAPEIFGFYRCIPNSLMLSIDSFSCLSDKMARKQPRKRRILHRKTCTLVVSDSHWTSDSCRAALWVEIRWWTGKQPCYWRIK